MGSLEQLFADNATATGSLAAAIFIVLRALNGIPVLGRSTTWRRLLPLTPIAMGIAGALLGGVAGGERSTVELVELGIFAGAMSGVVRKFLGQTVLADDPVLEAHRRVRENGHDEIPLGASDRNRSSDRHVSDRQTDRLERGGAGPAARATEDTDG